MKPNLRHLRPRYCRHLFHLLLPHLRHRRQPPRDYLLDLLQFRQRYLDPMDLPRRPLDRPRILRQNRHLIQVRLLDN